MKYIVNTTVLTLFDKTVEKIVESMNITQDQIYSFDYESIDEFKEFYYQSFSTSLFDDNKLLILKNASFLAEAKINSDLALNLKSLSEKETPYTIILSNVKVNKTSAFYKKFSKNYKIIDMKAPKGIALTKFIGDYAERNDFKIDHNANKALVERTNGKFDTIINELKKLALLETNVTVKVIEDVVYNYKGESVFDLLNIVFNRQSTKLTPALEKLRIQNLSPVAIVEMMINDLILIASLQKQKDSRTFEQLSDEYKIHPYRLKVASNYSRAWKENSLIEFLDDLIEFAKNIKINNPDDLMTTLKTFLLQKI